MSAQILFASRRWTSMGDERKVYITLSDTKNGKKYDVVEESLQKEYQCGLGDFLSFENNTLKKMKYLTTNVVGDVAYVDNIKAKLVCQGESWVFQTSLFSNALCQKYLPTGDYEVRISSLLTPAKLPSGETVYFEVTNERKIHEVPPNPACFVPIAPAPGGQPPVAPLPRSSAGTPTIPGSIAGSRPASRASSDGMVKGGGFPPKKFNKKPKGGVVGNGFPVQKGENQEKKLIKGEGFAPAKKDDGVVIGAGFEVKVQKTQKLRAVVLSITENEKTKMNTHFLWILDRQAEGRFLSKNYQLGPGHFFEGIFTENHPGKWNCQKYEKQFDKPKGIDGGLDTEKKIWFSVLVNQFQPAGGNRRFGEATAKYFGKVIEGELESTKLSSNVNGKTVKIQRRGIGEKDYVWMVVEILP